MSQLALQLIQQEKKEKTGYLDIGYCGLTPDNPQLQAVWSALSELTHLETLILSNTWDDYEEERPKDSRNNVDKNLLDKIPTAIADLVNLKKMVIAGDDSRKKWKISKLENLPQSISQLDIHYNQISKLENLPQSISQLSINNNQISKLENLPQNIAQLDIRSNQISKLENLPQSIAQLYISSNQISKLENLPQSIAQLDIDNNQISKLENLPQSISTLNVRYNQISKLENLPQSISQLYIRSNQISKLENLPQSIARLDISSNQISKLENLPQSISRLDISHNQISKLENLPQSISRLSIHYNQISKLENFPQNITYFDISNNQIKDITYLLSYIKSKDSVFWINTGTNSRIIATRTKVVIDEINTYELKLIENPPVVIGEINVYENPIENPPMEVVEEGNEAIIRYFEELEKSGEIQVKEAKLLLTGSGEVGKTSLRFRLNDKEKELPKKDDRTKQVEVEKYHFNTNSKENFTAHIWDFGGQQIIHHFHRFFMNDSSLYILLTETSRENDDFDYWLQTIQLYGKESPILFVQNKRNGMPRSLDIRHYQNNFNIKDELFNVNLLNNEGLDALEKAIQYYIQKLPHTQRTIPRSWLGIREALDALKAESGGYITVEKFREICGEQDITERAKIEDVGQFLHRLGVVLWYKDNPVLREKIILERHWATEGIFKLVFDEAIQKTGHFSFDQAQALWNPEDAYCHHTHDLIALMREFKICFPRKNQPDHYIIPALLTATAPHVEWKTNNRMTVEYHYPTILPRGLINYLTAEMYDDILKDEHAWSAGVWLHAGDTQAKIEENRFHRKIRITLSGAQHRELFGGIKKVIDNIHKDYPGMEPELRIPCICDTCLKLPQDKKKYYEYSDIVRRLEKGKPTAECNISYDDVPVKDLLNHILRREDYDATYRGEAKRIFVSYSHKDIDYRKELENRLKPLLRQQKIDDLWYDHKIMPGADWAAEIERNLRTADIVILLISDDFWASDFIDEKELPIVQARYEDEACVVIPIIVRANSYWEDNEDWNKFQAVPTDEDTGKLTPIKQWKDEDEAWVAVLKGIKAII